MSVADAVLYEGYLLYPYRSTSVKNQARWQFGVLGPPGASEAGLGEEPSLHTECLVRSGPVGSVAAHLRFLQLQRRAVEQADPHTPGRYLPVGELRIGGRSLVSWDEAIEGHLELGPFTVSELTDGVEVTAEVPGGREVEAVESDARIVRQRWPLQATVQLDTGPTDVEGVVRLTIHVANAAPAVTDRHQATRASLLGAHLVLEATDADFVSLLEPPEGLREAAAGCTNRRCWPVLVGSQGSTDVVLVSPIILYDYPAVAPESAGALFDSTEIDEILTLRVMTLTDQEKAEARATDPAAAAIIDRCEQMSPEDLQRLHGILRDPHASTEGDADPVDPDWGDPLGSVPTFVTPDSDDAPWWEPGVDASVSPTTDTVVVAGVPVAKGSSVRLHPSRNADAQDLFFADQAATVTGVFSDVDGGTHVAVVLNDDPAADLHEWYGRYLYFAPDELEPLGQPPPGDTTALSPETQGDIPPTEEKEQPS
jgi:hypothetical protein